MDVDCEGADHLGVLAGSGLLLNDEPEVEVGDTAAALGEVVRTVEGHGLVVLFEPLGLENRLVTVLLVGIHVVVDLGQGIRIVGLPEAHPVGLTHVVGERMGFH